METKNRIKKLTMSKTAILLSVCAATALCANLTNSCSGDEDYDKYKGDELNTRAAATRSVSEGLDLFVGSYILEGHTLSFIRTSYSGWKFDIMLQWTDGYTGNMKTPHSLITVTYCSPVGGSYKYERDPVSGQQYKKTYASASADWIQGDIILMTFKYSKNYYGTGEPYVYDTASFSPADIGYELRYASPDSATMTLTE